MRMTKVTRRRPRKTNSVAGGGARRSFTESVGRGGASEVLVAVENKSMLINTIDSKKSHLNLVIQLVVAYHVLPSLYCKQLGA